MSKILTKSLIGSTDVSFMDAPLVNVPNTTIVNRAQIRDLSKDMAPVFGVKRIQVQQIFDLQGEFGPNGERVFGALNDDRGLIRFVGSWANYSGLTYGSVINSASTTDYIEITFYGTGLNMLHLSDGNARDFRASVDGGAEGSNLIPGTLSTALGARNYAGNSIIPIASGLAIGVHTIKIRNNSANNIYTSGFEIITEASAITVLPGSMVKDQKRVSLDVASSQAFKPAALTGAKGGRVVIYNTGSAIGTAVQAVNVAQANLTSADHTNEEIIRKYYPREFGANRSDDFSSLSTSSGNRAFTLDDGVTTLVGSNVYADATATGALALNGVSGTVSITFVGTGLDIIKFDGVATTKVTPSAVTVDGVSIGSLSATGYLSRTQIKIVSGLPYGTHVVKFTNGSGTTFDDKFESFIVYGPKKPVVPTGATEIADYFVMADYVACSTAGLETVATGVIRKQGAREFVLIGSWTPGLSVTANVGGWEIGNGAAAGTLQYTFFGTGLEIRNEANTAHASSIQVSFNGQNATTTNFPSLVASSYGGNSFNTATGILSAAVSTVSNSGTSIRGLPLGLYTVKFVTGAQNWFPDAIDIVTPTHAAKSTSVGDLQNTLPIGNLALSDSRQALISSSGASKSWSQAVGVQSSPSSTSTTFVPVPDMSVTIKTTGGLLEIAYSVTNQSSGTANGANFQVYVDGVAVGVIQSQLIGVAARWCSTVDNLIVPVSPGVHKVDLMWASDGGGVTISIRNTSRSLKVREL